MAANRRSKRSKSAQNKIYYSVVGVSLVLIIVLIIVLVSKVNQNKPDSTESAPESQEFSEVDPSADDETDPVDTSDTETDPIDTSDDTVSPGQTTGDSAATTEGGASINTLPPQSTQKPTQTTEKPAQTTSAPTAPGNVIDEITLPLGFGYIDADSEAYVNDTAVNASYEGDYSGVIKYRQKNIDKLSLSGSTKNKVDRIVSLSASGAQDLYGNLSGDKLSLLSDSYPLSSNGSFSVTMTPKKGVTEYKNVTPVIFGGTASLRVYYLAEGIISYVYSESYQADLTAPSTLAWFEIRGEIYPD